MAKREVANIAVEANANHSEASYGLLVRFRGYRRALIYPLSSAHISVVTLVTFVHYASHGESRGESQSG